MSDDCVLILANGEWRGAARLHELAARADRVLATDGAWAKAVDAGVSVDCVIGDLDSLPRAQREALLSSDVPVQAYPSNKDFTDLELAVGHALETRARRLIVFGAFGGRIDHALANVLLLEAAVGRGVEVELIADVETAWIIRGDFEVPSGRAGDRVSLVALSEEAVVRTAGLRYPLRDEPLLRASGRGVSNVVAKPPARIAVRSGTLLVVHAPAEGRSG